MIGFVAVDFCLHQKNTACEVLTALLCCVLLHCGICHILSSLRCNFWCMECIIYVRISVMQTVIWSTDTLGVHLSMFVWYGHLALHVLMFSPWFSVLYFSVLKARKGSRILCGKAQNCERLVASKSVSSSQSLSNTANRSKRCSVGTQKHRGAVVQIAFTFILPVVSHDKPLQCVKEHYCKLCTLWCQRRKEGCIIFCEQM
jgi:hypothetical protein